MASQVGCADSSPKRPLGATCGQPAECASGRCVASECIEARLGPDGARHSPVVAYVTRAQTGRNLALVTLDDDGSMSEHPGAGFATAGGDATELAFAPDGRHAFVGSGRNGDVAVHVLDLDPRDFTPSENPYPPVENNSGLKLWNAVVVHPSGAFVYAADGESDGDRVYAYAVDTGAQPGRLTQTDSSADVFDVTLLSMDPLGRYLLAANQRDFGVFDLEASGALDGTLGTPTEQDTPDHLRAARFGAAGEHVYVLTDVGLEAFAFDRATATLSELVGSPFAAADGDMLEVHPLGGLLYESGNGAIFVHRINATGTVALIDIDGDALNGVTGYDAGVTDLAFDRTGDILYATGASTSSYLVKKDGLLTLIATLPVTGDRIAVLSIAR